jgi:hypothetical protein
MSNDSETRTRIQYALKERDFRMAALIVQSVSHAMDLIEEQTPVVLDAMYEYCESIEKTVPKERQPVVAAMGAFNRHAAREARRRENMLFNGLTGRPEPDEPAYP